MWENSLQLSADYVIKNLSTANLYDDKVSLWDLALSQVSSNGLCLEFGVWQGNSINYFSEKLSNHHFYGFDSFEGLAENWYGTSQSLGGFSLEGKLPAVRPNVSLIKGWFSKTLPGFLEKNKTEIAFIHLDADTYESTYEVLNFIRDRLVPGSIIVFDEYLGYPNWENGEFKAWKDFVSESGISWEYFAFSAPHQAALRIINM